MRLGLLAAGVCLGLVALTLIAYGSLLWGAEHEFVNFDDYEYVRDNPNVHAGLTPASAWWALTSLSANNWHPLTWISLQLDWQLWGKHPRGFLLTNVLVHAANTILLLLVLRRLSVPLWPAAAVAAFFAVHPLHVESVAWVTERKDVLSTFFWLLTMLAYIRYAERPGASRYILVMLCLTLGLMSKPMLVTLPCVLLLLDWWPLRRFSFSPPQAEACGYYSPPTTHHSPHDPHEPISTTRLLLEKVPLFALVAVACVLTIRAQGGVLGVAQEAVSLRVRVLNALVSYIAYLRQMVWPSKLTILYLHPGEKVSLVYALAAGTLLVGVTLAAACWWRSRPYLLLGWAWYLGTLVPVVGLLQVGQQARADRYTYIPLIGVFLASCWGAAQWMGDQRAGRLVLTAGTGALLVACIAVTRSQLKYWSNSTTLWDRALQVSGDDPHMHAVAVAQCLHCGELDDALRRARRFCELYPNNWRSHQFLGFALARLGKPDEARQSLERGLALEPDAIGMHRELASILWAQERIPAAFEQYAAIARLQPESAEGQHYRGIELQRLGKIDEAVYCLEEAVRLAPAGVLHHVDLALALEDKGDTTAAIGAYRDAIAINSRWPEYYDRLARILATHPDGSRRDGKEAIRRARAACSGVRWLTGQQYPPFLETLASAYAEAGSFEKAIETAQQARKLTGDRALLDRLSAALTCYEKGLPWRGGEKK
jgi:tetratricopeptide (TPR) repeat protein